MSYGSQHIPTEIRQQNSEKRIIITWDTGEQFTYSWEFLRVQCPCAACSGHTPDQAKLIDGKQSIRIRAINPVGHYAVKLEFDDDHDSGVYSWETLFDMGVRMEGLWQSYLEALKTAGKRRRPSVFPIKVV